MPGDPAPTSAPRTITPADDGRTYTMAVGQTTTLALTDSNAPEPVLDGTSVLLIEIVNITAGAGRQWEVRAVEKGTSSITDGGSADWVIRLEVT
jgi:predicted secreted protein